jgi:transcriptional regulator with XRE-family HTH domain
VDLFAYIGETLRRLRKDRGKTLDEIGHEAGLGRGQLSRIENGRQEATLTTLSKVLVSQGVSRREFFHRYEMVEAEAETVERTGGLPASAGGRDEWPAEVRLALKQVEAFVTAAFLQPRPVAQGTFELGDLVVLFRIVSKNPPPGKEEAAGAASPAPSLPPSPPSPPKPRAAKRPARRRKTR